MAIIKYKDTTTGDYVPVKTKTIDTLPVGTEVDFDGNEVPSGWTEVGGNTLVAYTLYNNASGNMGNITLNDNFTNYDYVEIFFTDDQNFGSSIKVRGNVPSFILSYQKPSAVADTFYFNSTRYTVSGNTISVERTLIFSMTTSTISNQGTTNLIKINRVVGYKEA